MESKIFGRKAKLYAGNASGNTLSDLITAFSNASLIKEISIGFPIKDGNGSLGGQNYLYQNGNFVNATASLWDSYASQWQLMPILFTTVQYEGNIDIPEAEGLFANRLHPGTYDAYFVTDDDLQYCQAMYVGAGALPSIYTFDKTTQTQFQGFFVSFAVWGNPKYTNYMWSYLGFIDDTTTGACHRKSSIGYAATVQSNSWWMQSSSSFYLPELTGFVEGYIPIREDNDPYSGDPDEGTSGTGGGTGDFDGTGNDIDIPSLPTLSATDTGFITLFNPSTGQLQALANYMWSSGFDLDTFKKLFADPMDCILGLSIVPVAVPNGNAKTVQVGNISTGVTMTVAASQYVEVDCGTLNVNEFWGAYLDYDPYTKAEIYLPYIGTHPLAVDDIMGKPVHVVYHVDILSGACTAFVKCGGSVLYEFIGQCSSSIPITGNDWTNVINGVISIAGAIGSMVATGGASAPMAAGMIASTAVNGMKPNVEKSGSMSGTGGMLAVQTPYLILTRPRQARPANQNAFIGYPSFITENLGGISGYTEIESIHLDGIPATEQELSEIETLLKGGVIF